MSAYALGQRFVSEAEPELARLRSLAEINDHVHPGEIARAEERIAMLELAIGSARVRLEALRLIRPGVPRGSA